MAVAVILARQQLHSCCRFSSTLAGSSRRHLALLSTKGKGRAQDLAAENEKGWSSSSEWETELRRRQKVAKERGRKGPTFADKVQVRIRAGRGGDGCVAFHREKFIEFGGPAGGNGGPGGSVYLRANETLQTLSAVERRIRAAPGESGKGGWQNGRGGVDVVVEVPVGTVVTEILKDAQEVEEESWLLGRRPPKAADLDNDPEKARERRSRLFVHYPDAEGENQSDPTMKQLELELLRQRWQDARSARSRPSLKHDFAVPFVSTDPSRAEEAEAEPLLVARGGIGGIGNAAFSGNNRRLPRFATKGQSGEEIVLDLELKTLADVGLVGFPNAGKSTLIRTLTNSRAEVASYAFTTLHPQVGTLVIYSDGSFSSASAASPISEDLPITSPYFDGARTLDSSRSRRPSHATATPAEVLRLTIADCPGLLPNASQNVGLGHSFLRHIERSSILVVVVDLCSGLAATSPEPTGSDPVDPDPLRPCKDVDTLLNELEAYRSGLSGRVALVVANKADLCVGGPLQAAAMRRLRQLEALVESTARSQVDKGIRKKGGDKVEVVPMSAKLRQNVSKVVALLQKYASTHGENGVSGDPARIASHF